MKPWRAVGLIAIVTVLAVAAGTAWAWANGTRFYAVQSGSMAPTINTGDLVVDMPIAQGVELRVGDVITFHPTPGYTTTHRIVAIGINGITTRGDANPSSDVGYIQPNMVIGRVAFSVPFGGYVAVFFQHPAGVAAVLLLLLALAFVWQLTEGRPTRQDCAAVGEEAL